MYYWILLLLAIMAEVLGTSTIKLLGHTYPLLGYVFLFTMMGISYYLLGKAIARIPMGIAYAVWEGLGMAAITVIGYLVFQEAFTVTKTAGIITVMIGIAFLKFGSLTEK